MAKILICFASMSGNTEDIADFLQATLEKEDHTVFVEEIEEIDPSYFREYDGTMIGSYTWNDGDLPYEVEDFYDELEEEDLSGVPVCVFGSGDRTYPQFCEAVHTLQQRLNECGATVIQDGLTIEMNPDEDDDIEKCKVFASNMSKYLSRITIQ